MIIHKSCILFEPLIVHMRHVHTREAGEDLMDETSVTLVLVDIIIDLARYVAVSWISGTSGTLVLLDLYA